MHLNSHYLGVFFTVAVLLFVIPASQASAEDVSETKHQTNPEISPNDVIVCEEG